MAPNFYQGKELATVIMVDSSKPEPRAEVFKSSLKHPQMRE
jgi:hypothetical protein